jgi:hypothetical protein
MERHALSRLVRTGHRRFTGSTFNLTMTALVLTLAMCSTAFADGPQYPKGPPFRFDLLRKSDLENSPNLQTLFEPKGNYSIFINYELGMHCVGFDISYCCIIPPYNSIQAQAVKSGARGEKPSLLSPQHGVKLSYFVRDNTYSEGNKMRYWQVPKDVSGNGTMSLTGRLTSRPCSSVPTRNTPGLLHALPAIRSMIKVSQASYGQPDTMTTTGPPSS